MRRRLAVLVIGGCALTGLLATPASAVDVKLCEAAGIILEFKEELPTPKLTVYVALPASEASPVLECE